MKTLKTIFIMIFALAFPLMCFGAESVTVTPKASNTGSLRVVYVDWVASAGGTKADVVLPQINMYLFMVATDPDGSTPPAANYGITLTDESGINVMDPLPDANPLADLSATVTEEFMPQLANVAYGYRFIDGNLTIAFADITNANAEGRITFYFVKP
jgi:hypothetical protein